MNKALYRRYRPETFQEVVGQEHVIAPLMASLNAGNTTHAYLFSGPRGCGKTTSARILARCLNCADYPTDTPCGHCDSCRELAREGSGSLDVVEMDAASHGGVDDARDLREEAGFAPVRDRFKIFIIDEAHMVSNQGFNALLKLVEEPPAHVKFIFATTEPEKVIGTIRSRTHHYPFHLVPPDILETYLEKVCAGEAVKAGKDVLSLAVRAGAGSVRDTLSVLDQLIGGSDGKELDYNRAVALLGYTSAHLLDEAVEAIAGGDGAALFRVVDSIVKSGHDPRRFVEDLLQRLRDLVIIALAGADAHDVFFSVPDDQYERMCDQAQMLGARQASGAADLVNTALTHMAGATAPQIQLELLCARLIVAHDAVSRETAVPQTTISSPAPAKEKKKPKNLSDPRYRPMPSFDQDLQKSSERDSVDPPFPASDHSDMKNPSPSRVQDNADKENKESLFETIAGQWDKICAVACEKSKIAANMLKHATGAVRETDGVLMVGFANEGTAAGFNRNQRARSALREAVCEATGSTIDVEGCVGSASDAHPKGEPAEVSSAGAKLAQHGNEHVREFTPYERKPEHEEKKPDLEKPLMPDEHPDHISDEIPFYAQEMPDLPPVKMPESLEGLYGSQTPISDSRERARHRANAPHSSADQNKGTTHTMRETIHDDNLNASMEAEPLHSRDEHDQDDQWDEVSADDPDISESSVVGLKVALRVFKGKVIEEIAHE